MGNAVSKFVDEFPRSPPLQHQFPERQIEAHAPAPLRASRARGWSIRTRPMLSRQRRVNDAGNHTPKHDRVRGERHFILGLERRSAAAHARDDSAEDSVKEIRVSEPVQSAVLRDAGENPRDRGLPEAKRVAPTGRGLGVGVAMTSACLTVGASFATQLGRKMCDEWPIASPRWRPRASLSPIVGDRDWTKR